MPVRAEWHAAKHDWSISHKQALHLIGLKPQLGWDKAQGVRVRRRLHQDLEELTNNKQQAETTPEKERSYA
jgi:hypothetical protein